MCWPETRAVVKLVPEPVTVGEPEVVETVPEIGLETQEADGLGKVT